MKMHKKIKIGILEMGTFAEKLPKYSEFEAEILGFNEKNMSVHLTSIKAQLPVAPWG